jgi:hypothetical protein
MSRFVKPDTVTLTLPAGDTLTVRQRLNMGEQRQMFARWSELAPDGGLRINRLGIGVATVAAYLVDWSPFETRARVAIQATVRGRRRRA